MVETQVITLNQLAAQMDVHPVTVKRMVKRGGLPAFDFANGKRGVRGWHCSTLQETLRNSGKVPG